MQKSKEGQEGQEMTNFNLHLKWNIEVKDKTGKVVLKKSGISKSLLRNFMYWFQSWFTLTTLVMWAAAWTAPDTSNTARTFPQANNTAQGNWGCFGGLISNSLFGLRLGYGDAAVSPVNYEMANLISHGVALNQMNYGGQTYEAVAVVGQVSSFRITRAFTNNSGLTITVKEIGSALMTADSAGVARYLCYLRDVLPSSVPVPDGSTFTLRYTFSVTA